MTEEEKQRFLEERAKALAFIVLTRRDDLTVEETKPETGLDFQGTVEREDNQMRLSFGVLVRGVFPVVTAERANELLGPTLMQFRGMKKFTYPVCLFFFTMREDRAFFTWLAEPGVAGGSPKLVHHKKTQCVPLTREVFDRAVEQIVAWYDAVATVLIA